MLGNAPIAQATVSPSAVIPSSHHHERREKGELPPPRGASGPSALRPAGPGGVGAGGDAREGAGLSGPSLLLPGRDGGSTCVSGG